ncbi:hypothetical protein Tco_1429568 [Tanacetum coccineum]
MAARKIFNDCMMEDFQDESNNLKDENMVASEGFMAYTQQGFYAVTNFQDEEADRLSDDWYTRPTDDEDDLDCLEEYLELHSSDGFIVTKDEEYKERMCKLHGMTY